MLLQLALLAYRLDHEEYPESLAKLSPDYLAEVPLDPYSQEPFVYRSEGLDLPLSCENYRTFSANTPLLWSVSSRVQELGKSRKRDADGDVVPEELDVRIS